MAEQLDVSNAKEDVGQALQSASTQLIVHLGTVKVAARGITTVGPLLIAASSVQNDDVAAAWAIPIL